MSQPGQEASRGPIIGLYPGSFDPIHIGHIDVAERASRVLDELYIGVATNPEKEGRFKPEERVELIEASLAHIPNLAGVKIYRDGLTVDHARALGATTMVRGERSVDDFLYEVNLFNTNTYLQTAIDIDPQHPDFVDTISFHQMPGSPVDPSSTLARELERTPGVEFRVERIRPIVPDPVFEAIVARMNEQPGA